MKLPDVATQCALAIAALVFCMQHAEAAKLQNGIQKNIYGGQFAEEGQFPWQVLMTVDPLGADKFCGGSIISEKWVLTAAHCYYCGVTRTLQFGTTRYHQDDAVSQTSHHIYKHENFTYMNEPHTSLWEHDIALIELSTPLTWSDTIQPVRLARRSQRRLCEGEMVRISGWGDTSAPMLTDSTSGKAEQTKPPGNVTTYSELLKFEDFEIGDSSAYNCSREMFLCSKWYADRAMYRGDSGGAIVWHDPVDGVYRQVGVNSQFFISNKTAPDQFMLSGPAVAQYLDWIAAKTGITIED